LLYDDELGEITQNKGHCAVQGHSGSPILVQIDFLLVINTSLPPILHRFWDIPFNRSKIAIFRYPCRVSWSLTSLFSTNMAISETKGQGWKVIRTQWRKA